MKNGARTVLTHSDSLYFVATPTQQSAKATGGGGIRKAAATRNLEDAVAVDIKLIDIAGASPLLDLVDGTALQVTALPNKLTVEAIPQADNVQSVFFAASNGTEIYYTRTESEEPYYLQGEKSDGTPRPFTFPQGVNLLAVTVAFSDGTTVDHTVEFLVQDGSDDSPSDPDIALSLIDIANNNAKLLPIDDAGTVLNLQTLPNFLTIAAEDGSGKAVAVVAFDYDNGAHLHIERFAPYHMKGEKQNGTPKTFSFLPGEHTLKVTVTFADGSWTSRAVDFLVVDEEVTPTALPTAAPSTIETTAAPSDSPSTAPTAAPFTDYVEPPNTYFVDAGSDEDAQSSLWSLSNKDKTYFSDVAIGGTGPFDPVIFQSHRWAGQLIYSLPDLLPSAPYNITLGFAEIYKVSAESCSVFTFDFSLHAQSSYSLTLFCCLNTPPLISAQLQRGESAIHGH